MSDCDTHVICYEKIFMSSFGKYFVNYILIIHLITITVNAFSRSFVVTDNEPLQRFDHTFFWEPVLFDCGQFLQCVQKLISTKDQYR